MNTYRTKIIGYMDKGKKPVCFSALNHWVRVSALNITIGGVYDEETAVDVAKRNLKGFISVEAILNKTNKSLQRRQ